MIQRRGGFIQLPGGFSISTGPNPQISAVATDWGATQWSNTPTEPTVSTGWV